MLRFLERLMEGEGDGTGDGSGTGAGTGDGTGTGTPAGSPAGDDTGGAPAADAGADTWFKGADEDTAAFITNKGWNDDPLRAVASYQHLEKMNGKSADSVVEIPRADDPEGQKAFWQKMGTPETADKYVFADAPEGQTIDPEYDTWARDTFLELGIPADKAAELFKRNNEYVVASQEKQAADYEAEVNADKEGLKDEWRDGHDKMMHRAGNAAKVLGIPADAINAIEATMGYGKTMKLFADLGAKMTEDNFISGDASNAFQGEATPAEAASKLEALKLDTAFTAALTDRTHPGHEAAIAKRRALIQQAHPQEQGTPADGIRV